MTIAAGTTGTGTQTSAVHSNPASDQPGPFSLRHGPLLRLKDEEKKRLKILFLAKWAEGDGAPDQVDGTHASYHPELRDTLRGLGFNVEASGRWQRLFEKPDYDFLFNMFNRAGFSGSEMFAPLLATYHQVPFFGAHPIIRGLTDDKHLMKLAVRSRGITTPDWMIVRRGCLSIDAPAFEWDNLIVKPNASSASWGIGTFDNWADAKDHVEKLLDEGHDVIVENLVDGFEIAIPMIGSNGPWFLPPLRFYVNDPNALRSYEQKRHLDRVDHVKTVPMPENELLARCIDVGHRLMPEIWPFDIARIELKYDEKADTLNFIEINLSCNLWSKKATALSAATIGVSHPQLVETLICHAMRRQKVVPPESVIEVPVTAAGS